MYVSLAVSLQDLCSFFVFYISSYPLGMRGTHDAIVHIHRRSCCMVYNISKIYPEVEKVDEG